MPTYVSPGAYVAERDFSLYVPALATSTFAVVGSASKGPMDTPTLITDQASLEATFGPASVDHLGLHAAVRYLRRGNSLLFVRVGTYNTAADSLTIQDAAALGTAMTVAPTSTGTWANAVSVVVTAGSDLASSYRITVRQTVNSIVYTMESYDNVLVGTANAASTNFAETRINGVSDMITVSCQTIYATLLAGTSSFAGGDDGAPVDNSDIVGSVGTPPTVPATGLQTLANPETLDVNIVAVPGYSNNTIIAALLSLCTSRADCIALMAPPYGKSVQEAVDWHNGTGGGAGEPTAALNSSYGATYYPWLEVFDGASNSNVWIPPEGHVAAVMAYTDLVADPWWAPAGLNRALLVDVLDIEHSATQGERNWMYSFGNAVNPICNYQGQGYTIWGQRTLQRAPTALDRVNVRRLMCYMEKIIATAVRYLVFEPNDEITWARFVNLVSPVCRTIKNRRGLYDFRVICDATTNTAVVINRNEMVGKILLQPTKTAEMISIEFVLTPSGASFDEFVAA